jgi:hypothetical protein
VSGPAEPRASLSVYRLAGWLAAVTLLLMLVLLRGPVSRAFDAVALLVVFGGGSALACVSAPVAAHRHAWSLALANAPVDPELGRAARVVLRTEARALLVMGGLAALLEIISSAPFLADPLAQRMVLQSCGIALLYGLGGAGLMVWPAMASIERREGATALSEVGVSAPGISRSVLIGIGVMMLVAFLLGWLAAGQIIELAASDPSVPVDAPAPAAAAEP